MPLTPPEPRKRLHRRSVSYEGYQRDDGLFDVEAHITDVKDHDHTLLTGVRRAGESLHDMWVRVTIDANATIRAIEAKTDVAPYPGCERIEPAYAQLVGDNLLRGFRKGLHDKLGGVSGCTHVTELLGYLPTAAVQMFAGLKKREDEGEGKPFQLDRCHALHTSGDVVRRFYPKWYRGAEERALESR